MMYAPWCGHCKRLHPTWNQLAAIEQLGVSIAKINVDAEQHLSPLFGVSSFPTLMRFSNGNVYEFQGKRELEELKAFAVEGFKSVKPANKLIGPGSFPRVFLAGYTRWAMSIVHHLEGFGLSQQQFVYVAVV